MMYDTALEVTEELGSHTICIDWEVLDYISNRQTDFRISTSCGGPILLPLSYKQPKPTDITFKAGGQTIYISIYQARYIDHIHMGLVPWQTRDIPEEEAAGLSGLY